MTGLLVLLPFACAALGASGPPDPQQAGGIQVVCDGLFCGGSGGNSASQFLYRVEPNGTPISSIEIGVEDGDLAHYADRVQPGGWTANIRIVARAHDVVPSRHGSTSGSQGTCPYALRFSGSARVTTFSVGYSYTEGCGYHDVSWRASNGRQSAWSVPVGPDHGPVHSPIQNNAGHWEPPFVHDISSQSGWSGGQPGWDGEDQTATRHFLAGHMALIPVGPHRGEVLVWNWMRNPSHQGTPPKGYQHWSIVDVSSSAPAFSNYDLDYPGVQDDLFCSGHAWTKVGDLLVAGGDQYVPSPTSGWSLVGNELVYRFVPTNPPDQMWQREPDGLHRPRWYPSVTALGTDAAGKDILIVSGGTEHDGSFANDLSRNTFEAFDPTSPPGSGTWQRVPPGHLPDYVFDGPALGCNNTQLNIYPRAFLLGTSQVFFAGMGSFGYWLDYTSRMGSTPPQVPTWTFQNTPADSALEYGSAFLYANLSSPSGGYLADQVVRVGGKVIAGCTFAAGTESAATQLAGPQTGGEWSALPDMVHPRAFPNTVLLPDGSAVAVSASNPTDGTPTFEPEVFNDDPAAPYTWRALDPAAVLRGYHSAAVLLPDGRVLVGGGEARTFDYEILRPHYLTNGTQRPRIVSALGDLSYGQTYSLTYAPLGAGVTVERVVLMAPGSVTHHSDMHQRYVELATLPSTPPVISFQAPPDSKHAPRGYYMLFLVTNVQAGAQRRAPSTAIWVNLHP